jgi:DNA-binding NtrC family response regulator
LRDKTLLKLEDGQWDAVIDVHLKGTFLCTQVAAKQMIAQGDGGRIVNTTSVSGMMGNFGQANYAAAKAGIYGFTRTAAIELSTLPYHEAKKVVMDRFEEEYFPQVLDRAGGVISKAAELAGVARPSFYRMIERVRPGYTKKQSIPPAP